MFQNIIKFSYKSLLVCCLCAAPFAASHAIFTVWSSGQAAETQCLYNDCERLGYKRIDALRDTPCESFLACPYDSKYIKCDLLPTCKDLGFTKYEKQWCSNIVRCPTDPSYTLCRSLCGGCAEGTALDPADLNCANGYKPSYRLVCRRASGKAHSCRSVPNTNDCGQLCYECKDCDDGAYWCKDGMLEDCSKDENGNEICECRAEATLTSCEKGTYISEVRRPTCLVNSSLQNRYICEKCPEGWTNESSDKYTCDKCNEEKGYYNTCPTGSKCTEIHSKFGTCFQFGGCDETLYPLEEIPLNASASGSYCSDDDGPHYMGFECNEGYILSDDKESCECDLSVFKYSPGNPEHSKFRSPTFCSIFMNRKLKICQTCMKDSVTYHKDFECEDGYEKSGEECVKLCDIEEYPYTTAPAYGSLMAPICEDSSGNHYSNFTCNDGYEKSGDKCVCDTEEYPYTENNKPKNSTFTNDDWECTGSSCYARSCTDSQGKHYDKFFCLDGTNEVSGECMCDLEKYSQTTDKLCNDLELMVDSINDSSLGAVCNDKNGPHYNCHGYTNAIITPGGATCPEGCILQPADNVNFHENRCKCDGTYM